MKLNLLLSNIQAIQIEYKELLLSLLPKLKNRNALEALDEINVFWLRNIKTIQLYLKTWFPSENSYVFTAATFMDFDDNEHMPFLLMGEKHVFDDPLSKYSEICSKTHEDKFSDFLFKQIYVTAKDNIKLLENTCNEILILPLRLLDQSNKNDFLYETGEKVFISIFNDINSLDDYFAKCNSINDIIRFIRDDADKMILFSENDDVTLPFEKRFQTALNNMQYMLDINKPDSYNFYMLVYGYMQQAIDIIVSCIEYGCVPYVRNPISLCYISLLSKGFVDIDHINTLCFKMNVAYVVHNLFDKKKLATMHIEEFLKRNREYGFSTKLFMALERKGISEKNYFEHEITSLVIDELEKYYNI